MIHNQAPIHQGNYDPAYLAQNIHYALLGNNQMSPTDPTAAEMSSYPNTFLLNKSLFKVHAEHHHTFSPYWMKQFEPVGHIDPTFANAIGIGPATQKSAYMGTFRDKIKLKTKLSAKGNVSVSQTPTYNGLAEGPVGLISAMPMSLLPISYSPSHGVPREMTASSLPTPMLSTFRKHALVYSTCLSKRQLNIKKSPVLSD
jgi:hypothetical protein